MLIRTERRFDHKYHRVPLKAGMALTTIPLIRNLTNKRQQASLNHILPLKDMTNATINNVSGVSNAIGAKSWVSTLVVGIVASAIAACGVFIAYKQLRRTKRPADIEAADMTELPPRRSGETTGTSQESRSVSTLCPALQRPNGMKTDMSDLLSGLGIENEPATVTTLHMSEADSHVIMHEGIFGPSTSSASSVVSSPSAAAR